MIIGYTDPPIWQDSTAGKPRPFGAPEYMILRENTLTIDQLSYRGRRAWTNQNYRLDAWQGNPSPLGLGSFLYRVGLTTLTVVVQSNTAGDTYRVYIDGVLRNSTTTINGVSTITVAINALGFVDYQVCTVEIRVERAGGTGRLYEWHDAYVSPCSSITLTAGSWPGVPTFGDLNAANLNQLASCQRWLFERLNVVVQAAFTGQMYRYMLAHINTGDTVGRAMFFSGSLSHSNGATRLHISGTYEILTTPQEKLQLFINNAFITETSIFTAWTAGAWGFDVDISGYTVGQRIDIRVDQVVVAQASVDQRPARYRMDDVYTSRSSYPVPTTPAAMQPRDSVLFSTLQTRLNQLGTILSDDYARINAAPDIFDRMRLFRHRPVVDNFQDTYFATIYLGRGNRAHDALWIKGKSLKLGWGAIKRTPDKEDPYKYEFQYDETLTQTDQAETRLVYFDSFDGLYFSSSYFVFGEQIYYVGEQLQ